MLQSSIHHVNAVMNLMGPIVRYGLTPVSAIPLPLTTAHSQLSCSREKCPCSHPHGQALPDGVHCECDTGWAGQRFRTHKSKYCLFWQTRRGVKGPEQCKQACSEDMGCHYAAWWHQSNVPCRLSSRKCNMTFGLHYTLFEKIASGSCGIDCTSIVASHCSNAGTCDASGGVSVFAISTPAAMPRTEFPC